jgi:preprotein translocase subunit SecE
MANTKQKSAKKKSRPAKQNAIVVYFRETRAELRKVHWPTRDEALNLTKVVLAVTVGMAAFLGILDFLFSIELGGLVSGSVTAIVVVAVSAVACILAYVFIRRQAT